MANHYAQIAPKYDTTGSYATGRYAGGDHGEEDVHYSPNTQGNPARAPGNISQQSGDVETIDLIRLPKERIIDTNPKLKAEVYDLSTNPMYRNSFNERKKRKGIYKRYRGATRQTVRSCVEQLMADGVLNDKNMIKKISGKGKK